MRTIRRDDMTSEALDQPVKVLGPDGERTEPCVFRKRGLAIWKCLIEDLDEAMEAGWPSNAMFNVTHEVSGTLVCTYPTLLEATCALFAANTLTDWTQSEDAVKAVFKADQMKGHAIMALHKGRLDIVRQGFPAFCVKAGVA